MRQERPRLEDPLFEAKSVRGRSTGAKCRLRRSSTSTLSGFKIREVAFPGVEGEGVFIRSDPISMASSLRSQSVAPTERTTLSVAKGRFPHQGTFENNAYVTEDPGAPN